MCIKPCFNFTSVNFIYNMLYFFKIHKLFTRGSKKCTWSTTRNFLNKADFFTRGYPQQFHSLLLHTAEQKLSYALVTHLLSLEECRQTRVLFNTWCPLRGRAWLAQLIKILAFRPQGPQFDPSSINQSFNQSINQSIFII